MAERCARCNVNGNDVRLFDAVYNGKMSQICERCSIIENVPIIKKPNVSQLKISEEREEVYKRVKRLAGFKDSKKQGTFFIEDKLKELDNKPELELPEKEQLNLVEHFHWIIMKNRRQKGLSQKQLAEVLGESETVVQMIEKALLPENAEVLIKKLEQFFQTRLRKVSEMEKIMREKRRTPILLNEKGKRLEIIPEKELKSIRLKERLEPELVEDIEEPEVSLDDFEPIEIEEEKSLEEEFVEESGKVRDLDVRKVNLNKVTIRELRNLHRKKIEATKQEQIKEQKQIEEKQRLIEARKEELRLRKEKESEELDNVLGGIELLESENDFEIKEDFDEEFV